MKKLFFALPLVGVFMLTSCEKEPETITETITETVNESVVLTLEPFDQDYYTYSLDWGSVKMDYSATNLGDKEISMLEVKFEAKTSDGSTYAGSDYFFDLGKGETLSSQVFISVADKECVSVKVKELDITTY